MASPETKVYRLRGIPAHLDRLGVTQLIQPFLPNGKLEDITVSSLALTCEFWVRNPTKTATITLRKLPEIVCAAPTAGEWELPVLALPKPLILDDTFYGLTPLNEVAEAQHHCDCVVISGLASHPMGSWQPRGIDKSFMWIRDKLPELVPGVRFILYGYDTKLVGSKSFQTASDLANNLINELKTGGWSAPSLKPLAFLAHSLGGVVLKQCFLMLADSGVSFESILQKTKGAIFFGVPTEGMDIEDIHVMLGNQPNKDALIAEISSGSTLLPILEKQISGISQIRGLKQYWAYETQTTPTVELVDGTYRRSGPDTILVSRASATGNRCTSEPSSTIQIDANHSEMVKFSSGSHMIGLIANKLRDIIGNDQVEIDPDSEHLAVRDLQTTSPTVTALVENNFNKRRDPSQDVFFWDLDAIIQSIRPPERDKRLEQIDKSAGCSFEWAFEDPSIGLNNWLQKGDGLYWVSGRPASGKSTFMKFLHHDKRTSRLLRRWYSKAVHVEANFFFHYRGSLIQKSFEGLLRSILSQILEQAPGTRSIIHSIAQHRYRQLISEASLGDLYLDLQRVFAANDARFGPEVQNKLMAFLDCETPKTLFRTMVMEPLCFGHEIDNNWDEIEQNIIPRREQLLEHLRRTVLLKHVPSTEKPQTTSKTLKSLKQTKLLEVYPPVYCLEWNNETRYRFAALLTDWLEAIDLKENMLNIRGLSSYRPPAISTTRNSKHETKRFTSDVDNIMIRYHNRERIRQIVQNETWTPQRLEEALFHIINQNSIDLDLFIFIDALDEHDGLPEFIAEFLKDITKQRDSLTRLKIIFSSRPWDKFTEAFSDCPGFCIHEHTENDIRELCSYVIQNECPESRELLQLVDEIVKRAKGVFLWVKLVLYDLSKIVAGTSCENHTGALSSKLQEALRSLPHDLIDYYSTIVERIPQSFRREAFCLLEVVAKGDDLYLAEVPKFLSCLNFSRFTERNHILENLSNLTTESLAISLRAYTGGLIEIYGEPPHLKLQLLHQTTVYFVQLPEFKALVLGSGAHAMMDNGHTFLAKSAFLQPSKTGSDFHIDSEALRQARLSESTTGRSLYKFFSGGSSTFEIGDFFEFGSVSSPRYTYMSGPIIGVAFGGYLRLLIQDALDANSLILYQTTCCCPASILYSFMNRLCGFEEAIQMIGTLATHDFKFENHLDWLGVALCFSRDQQEDTEQCESLILNISRRLSNPDIILTESQTYRWTNHKEPSCDDDGGTRMIHLSSYNITKEYCYFHRDVLLFSP